MHLFRQWKPVLACIGIILLMLFIVSIIDILIVIINSRFYSTAAFITIFGVGGIFAAIFAYMYAIKFAPEKDEWARWSLILTIIISGLLFFFLLSKIEGGEYAAAFKAYGLALAITSFIFMKGKVDF